MSEQIRPYQEQEGSKKAQVVQMFDNIAPQYDLLNRALSMGIDVSWRKKAIRKLRPYQPAIVVDIATGTGDFALAATKLDPEKVIGIDISPGMLELGRKKVKDKKLDQVIEMREGDSEKLPLETESIDAITVGFGVRNFENLSRGLSEIHRVLKSGKAAVILEPSFPTRFPLKQLFFFHFRILTPLIGKLISGDNAAYTYLPESVKAFPHGEDFLNICREAGFRKGYHFPLTGGICAMYLLEK